MNIEMLKEGLTDTGRLGELQKDQTLLLASLIEFFNENQLSYFVSGGTMLGSRYYKGFIPYDDDIDIAMPRKDFQRLLDIVERKKFFLKNFDESYNVLHFLRDPSFKYTIARVENLNYQVIDIMDINNTSAHPSIDIAPIDGSPNNRFARKVYFTKLYFRRGLLMISYADTINPIRRDTLRHKIQTSIAKIISHFFRLNPTNIKLKIEKTLSRYDMNESEYSGTYMGTYRDKEMIPTFIWGKGSKGVFEGIDVVLPEQPDEYVSNLYGGFRFYTDDELLKDRHYIIKEQR